MQIGEGLARDAVAGVIDGELVDTDQEITDGDTLKIVTESSDEYTEVLRHSAAHVFAQALKNLQPNAKLAIGPYTEEGFYYDIGNVSLEEEDLDEIKQEMEEIVEQDHEIKKQYITREELRTNTKTTNTRKIY
jgi:threonyl-tRNA synthetase (EC 6.1.1.3)/Ser-tRNA(Thr) hydrolase (EC 3.1.1.-)